MRRPIHLPKTNLSRRTSVRRSPQPRFCTTLFVVAGLGLVLAKQSVAQCDTPIASATPLNDLGPGFYQNYQGGLYPSGLNQRPEPHNTDGINIATDEIIPRDTSGNKDLTSGKIVMVSIGMSNTRKEFGGSSIPDPNSFIPRTVGDKSLNPKLVFVDGAQAGADAPAWTDPNSAAWMTITKAGGYLDQAMVGKNQVQVVWLKEAWIFAEPDRHWPPPGFPAHAIGLQADLEKILQNVKINFPKCRIAYLSPRTRAYSITYHNPEPEAYETGFAIKWTIADQIAYPGGSIGYTGTSPAAPWICWGPYLWTNGRLGRSDGMTWECGDSPYPNDVRHIQAGGSEDDYIHPSSSGIGKVADQLFAFLKTDPTATPWFLTTTITGTPPAATPSASPGRGHVPLAVTFHANASDSGGTPPGIKETLWTFDDGDYSFSADPVKTFPAPGTYKVHLTVIDNDGNSICKTRAITVIP